jgi:alkanesulfonate monooxygenase SsuD/methylene tetrahydromethanopterin reductase-like flavin-dependent oxidoreductase (luciferase family)
MRFGLAVMNDFPRDIVPADRIALLREQVVAARDSGIDSIWALQHYLGNMPTLQPLLLLSALASDCGDMYLGTNMYILPLRHPVGVAEEFATLDHLTNGHAIAGFGMGYRDNEFKTFGVPMDSRVERFEESVAIVRSLWAGRPVTHHGTHFDIENQRLSLEPVQRGGPRIWIGAGPHRVGAERAATLGDAWIIPPHVTPERLGVLLGYFTTHRERLGRVDTPELVVRRELLLDEDRDRARTLGLAARGALSNQYAAFNAPGQAGYRHLASAKAAEEVADQSYLFTDPPGAIAALRALSEQGVTYVVLRMQWYDLPQNQVLRTLALFRDQVLPGLAGPG